MIQDKIFMAKQKTPEKESLTFPLQRIQHDI